MDNDYNNYYILSDKDKNNYNNKKVKKKNTILKTKSVYTTKLQPLK